MSDATDPIACAMPSLAPRTAGSGQTTGKTLGGNGMREPENAPYRHANAVKDASLFTPIHAMHSMPLDIEAVIQGIITPIRDAAWPPMSRPAMDAAWAAMIMFSDAV